MSIVAGFLRITFVALILYLLAAPLTDKISFDLRLTEWLNVWTYVFWLFSGALWVGLLYLVLGAIAAVIVWLDL